mgnify:FL=1
MVHVIWEFCLQLSDLVMLDEGCLAYPYGVLAASILYHFGNETTTENASGEILFFSSTFIPF